MTVAFNKDNWIKRALISGYMVAREDGSIYRSRATQDGGVIASAPHKKVKVQVHKKTGRVYFNLTYMGFKKSVLVNRVIALRFLPNPEGLPVVNHKDGDKEHNAKDNLEWSTNSDNEKHAHRTGLKSGRGGANSNAKLTSGDVEFIRRSTDDPATLARRFGVSRSTITNVLSGKTWTHI